MLTMLKESFNYSSLYGVSLCHQERFYQILELATRLLTKKIIPNLKREKNLKVTGIVSPRWTCHARTQWLKRQMLRCWAARDGNKCIHWIGAGHIWITAFVGHSSYKN